MKAVRQVPADSASSRRAQPVRQARTNPARARSNLERSFGAKGAGRGAADDDDEQHNIFPAITDFADAITALPREIVRHFTLLKEVDAKIFAPEEQLGQLVNRALNMPVPEPKHTSEQQQLIGQASSHNSVNGSTNVSIVNGHAGPPIETVENYDRMNAVYDPTNIPRRQMFRQVAYTMQEMLVSLDEKNHVISTATEALDKQLARLAAITPHVENEFSEEAKWGSTRHWAYADNRIPVKASERSKKERENVNALSKAAAEAAAEEAARKQPSRDKKGRNHHNEESDFDHQNKRTKKNKPDGANGPNGPPLKRRKVDKGANGAGMERSASGVGKNKKDNNSPRETPIPDPKKRAKATGANGQPRKRTVATNAIANSPSVASSPVLGTFGEVRSTSRISPPANGRPTTARSRKDSLQGAHDAARQRPSSSASNKPNGAIGGSELNTAAAITGRPVSEIRAVMKDTAVNGKGEHIIEDADSEESHMRGALVVGSKRESGLKHEDSEATVEETRSVQQTAIPVPVTTKSGRTTKPSTPALGGESMARTGSRRSNIGTDSTNSSKRSHKKGAGQAAALVQQVTHEDEDVGSAVEEEQIAEDEPRYCYCNGVSYGEMVACDADGCAKEWFHLECVGLKVAPKGNAKWYCDDCKEHMRGRRFNGR